jgi:hypothetical protein
MENLKGRDHLEDRCRWEDNIGMDVREIGWEDVGRKLLDQGSDHW